MSAKNSQIVGWIDYWVDVKNSKMEKVNWKVEGMTCTNCALSVTKVLQKQGMEKVNVNAISGDVQFIPADNNGSVETAKKNIERLGYKIVSEELAGEEVKEKRF